eukprot:CAMPEP_0178991740 /NCGR_PEP_ID=MMETSP0795-20121207/5707_1 /TAXON_ID=88552 /ORGANISM="Amoebophrya sp., Strain Ameob2" /LENGTH=464 /DNA_ID=CAMNT_0020683505 /DNA_START=233 /DNA_END=1629 /DNA_ORIENTATION=+
MRNRSLASTTCFFLAAACSSSSGGVGDGGVASDRSCAWSSGGASVFGVSAFSTASERVRAKDHGPTSPQVGIEVDIEAESFFSTSGTGGGGEEQGDDRPGWRDDDDSGPPAARIRKATVRRGRRSSLHDATSSSSTSRSEKVVFRKKSTTSTSSRSETNKSRIRREVEQQEQNGKQKVEAKASRTTSQAYVIRGNPKTYADSDTSFQDDETVCGRNNGTAKLNNKTEKHGVRCCGDGQTAVEENGGTWKQSSGGGSNSWYYNSTSGVEVDCSTPEQSCSKPKNHVVWADIFSTCATIGRRPCTVEELKTPRNDSATKLLCDGAGGGCDNYCIWTANEGQDEEGVGEEGDSADNESTEAPPAASGDDGSADNESTEAPPTASGDDGSADNETSTEAPPAASGDEAETSGEASSSTGIVNRGAARGGGAGWRRRGVGEGDETEDDSGEGEGGDEGDDLSDLKNRGS